MSMNYEWEGSGTRIKANATLILRRSSGTPLQPACWLSLPKARTMVVILI
jgi:hypothetical protein